MAGTLGPRWLADEMLGRLTRYLRFFGHDTVYGRGRTDTEIVEQARREERIVLTRDRQLAGRSDRALLIRSPAVLAQVAEVQAAFPSFSYALSFDRCPECNHPLERWTPPADESWPDGLPVSRIREGLSIQRCPDCHRFFWDGSHTDRIRERLATIGP